MSKRTMEYRGKTIYLAKFDVVFKAIFIGDGDYSLLASLLSSILNLDIKAEDIEVLNVEIAPDHKSGRLARLDIRVKTACKRHINIEIQLYDEKNMDKRSIFHLSKLYTQQLAVSMKFNDLHPAIAINILDFKYLPYTEYHNVYRLKNIRTNDELTDVFEINFIEMPKIPSEINSPIDLWMKFLSAENEEELEMLAKQSPVMEKAVQKLVHVSAEELVRYEMDMREKAELDYRSAMADSYDDGRQEGRQEGAEEKAYRAAERALKRGVRPEDVAYDQELPLSKIMELKERL